MTLMAAFTNPCSLSIKFVRGASSGMRVEVASTSLPLADVLWVRGWAWRGSREDDERTAGDERVAATPFVALFRLRTSIGLPPGFLAAHLPTSTLRPFTAQWCRACIRYRRRLRTRRPQRRRLRTRRAVVRWCAAFVTVTGSLQLDALASISRRKHKNKF